MSRTNKKFDVFLSHHSSDKPWVINLKKILEDQGISVWLDKDEIRPGDLFAKALEDGLKSSQNIVFIVTKKSMKSKWVEEEYYRALSLSKSKKQPARLIPIVLQTTNIPGFLNSRNWVDFRNESEFNENIEKLIWGITGKDKYRDAEQRYIELSLKAYDIIDLGNLPDQDFRIATQRLDLRNLYVTLKIKPEIEAGAENREIELEAIENRRKATRNDRNIPGESKNNINKTVEKEAVSLGIQLSKSKQLVILGDPGAGKTTLLKWLATAFLLRIKGDKDWRNLPDIDTLPKEKLFPVIVRCRELPKQCLDGTLDDILSHVLQKLELDSNKCKLLLADIHEKLRDGELLLLVDGLDEITDSSLRICFCKQLERIHDANPTVPIIVTSRIVGYKEMGDRILRRFEHATVADLSKDDKEVFAYRWYEVTEATESAERRVSQAKGLIEAIDTNNRLQRLTSNPMMLTTLALVKRKVGKLPSRRARLYWEAVQVLLNWRHEIDAPIDDHEAMPQLEYLAYSMCKDGIQQIREDQIIYLLEQFRKEYPNIHAIQQHSPVEFLRLIIRRTGILIKTGFAQHHGGEIAVYEFKHLTFQEYLAGLSLVRGHFPGFSQSKSLSEHIALLVSHIPKEEDDESTEQDNWREAVRLCVASCNDTDVDSLLKAILIPQKGEDNRAIRAIEATLCLADDVNASDVVAREVLEEFCKLINKEDGNGYATTTLELTVIEMVLSKSHWLDMLRSILIEEVYKRSPETRGSVGGISGMITAKLAPSDEVNFTNWLEVQVTHLTQSTEPAAIESAFGIMQLAWEKKIHLIPGLIDGLLTMLNSLSPVVQHAAAWALGWLNNQQLKSDAWRPNPFEKERLITAIRNPDLDPLAVRYLSWIFRDSRERDPQAVEPLIQKLNIQIIDVQTTVINALGQIGDVRSVASIIKKLKEPSSKIRLSAVVALGNIRDGSATNALFTCLNEDENSDVRENAVIALSKIGNSQVINALINATLDPIRNVRRTALIELGELIEDLDVSQLPNRTIEVLINALEDQDSDVREEAAKALGKSNNKVIDSKLRTVVIDQLIIHLKDTDTRVQENAAEALGLFKTQKAIEPLVDKLNSKNSSVRNAAVIALGQIGDTSVVDQLIEMLEDSSSTAYIIWALGELRDEKATKYLINLLNDSDGYIRYLATFGISKMKNPKTLEHIIQKFSDKDFAVRQAALEAYLDISKGKSKVEQKLLTVNIDGVSPFIDIQAEINKNRVEDAAVELNLPAENIYNLYEEIAKTLPLKLSWVSRKKQP